MESHTQFKENAFDKTVYNLCEEVDYWKYKYQELSAQYEELRKDYSENINQQLESNKNMIGNIFKIMLNTEQTETGILINQQTDK